MDFKQLADLAMKEHGLEHMRPVIEKELLHYEILRALNADGLLENLTFQGGTCLRLCYGSNRYSEDLDFAGGRNFVATDMKDIQTCIHKWITEKYDLPITVKSPKNLREEPVLDHVTVDVWRIAIETAPEQRNMKRQVIKIDIANVDALTKTHMPLLKNYVVLPEQDFEFYPVQSLEEILCDKLVALVNCTEYVRHRDIWDIVWLTNTKNTSYTPTLDPLIAHKIQNYHIENYGTLIENFLARLNSIVIGKDFKDQMTRFLPIQQIENTFNKPGFLEYVEQTVRDQLAMVQNNFTQNPTPPKPFKM